MDITAAIKQVRDEFIRDGEAPSYYAINDGLCEEFALEVLKRALLNREQFFDVQGENFMEDDNDAWDFDLLIKHWDFKLPEGLTEGCLNTIRFGGHVWIADYVGKRFYDAECPEGVGNFFDLPLFRRYIISYLRKNGVSCPDVETDDVTPAPRCPTPNPLSPVQIGDITP